MTTLAGSAAKHPPGMHSALLVQLPHIRLQQIAGPQVQMIADHSYQVVGATDTPTATGTATPTPLATAAPETPAPVDVVDVTLTPPAHIPTVYVSSLDGRFFTGNSAIFTVATQTPWVFSKSFSALNFNPGSMSPCTITPVVNRDTRPFTDLVVTNPCVEIPAQVLGNPTASAGLGNLSGFQAVFSGDLYVSEAGDITLNIYSDDGFILGLGPNRDSSGVQPSWLGGTFAPPRPPTPPYPGPTPWPTTTFRNYLMMGQFNTGGYGNAAETIRFPTAGFYPFELDYAENGAGGLSLAIEYSAGTPAPPGPSATPTAMPTSTPTPLPTAPIATKSYYIQRNDLGAARALGCRARTELTQGVA
ncbi:MAG: hypothetical protein M3Z04_22515, partial [Chloroflexota bacterium]|nr:hypothetical protein [Chloroflexota bacterium]